MKVYLFSGVDCSKSSNFFSLGEPHYLESVFWASTNSPNSVRHFRLLKSIHGFFYITFDELPFVIIVVLFYADTKVLIVSLKISKIA